MKKYVYECKDMQEAAYGLFSYVLKNRISHAVIDFPQERIMEQMMSFLVTSGLTCSYLDEGIEPTGLLMTCEGQRKTGIQTFYVRSSEEGIPENCSLVIFPGMMNEKASPERRRYTNISDIPEHLKNEQIRPVFEFAFETAQKEVDVISPWMNRTAVNDTLISKMEGALKRGAKIKIIYGIGKNDNGYNQKRSERSDAVAIELLERFSCFGNRFKISRDNIHYKLVLCDELFRLEGGFNYLSFLGNYDEPGIRKEGTPFDRDVRMIRMLREEYFGNV